MSNAELEYCHAAHIIPPSKTDDCSCRVGRRSPTRKHRRPPKWSSTPSRTTLLTWQGLCGLFEGQFDTILLASPILTRPLKDTQLRHGRQRHSKTQGPDDIQGRKDIPAHRFPFQRIHCWAHYSATLRMHANLTMSTHGRLPLILDFFCGCAVLRA